jgi:hypothetical protein
MLKHLIAGIFALALMAGPVMAQTYTAPAAGEFGPQAWVSDGLTEAQMSALLQSNGTTHTNGESAPDTLGAFRFICEAGQVLADDPIVYPGQKGKSHAHQFYGNLDTNYATTYSTGRQNGLTTCQNKLNRSHYWMPAMIDGNGDVVRPDYVSIYYKREPKTSGYCTSGNALFKGECVGLPNGLKFIFGYDMITGTIPTGSMQFNCVTQPGNVSGPWKTNIVDAAQGCAVGSQIQLKIIAPNCWDGANLDSANHRSHLADAVFDPALGKVACPSTHPKLIPHFELGAFWTVDATLDTSGTWTAGVTNTWHLSCDKMYGMTELRPGTCFHADYFEGWNEFIKKMWIDNCIDRQLNCSGADLGNGYSMVEVWPLDYQATPRIVNRPAMAKEPFKLHVHPVP